MPSYSDKILAPFAAFYEETTYNVDGNPATITRWTDSGKGTLLYDCLWTYTGTNATTVRQRYYTAGALSKTQTITKTYDSDGNELTSTSVVS